MEIESIYSIPFSALPPSGEDRTMSVKAIAKISQMAYAILDSVDNGRILRNVNFLFPTSYDLKKGDQIKFTHLTRIRWNPLFQHIDHDCYGSIQCYRAGMPLHFSK